jgi:general secretion pathway protein D
LACALAALSGCDPGYLQQRTDQTQNASDVVNAIDLKARFPQPTSTVDTGASPPRPFSFFGTQAPAPPAVADAATGATEEVKDGFTLNFENSPVSNVAKVILGDILGVGYVVDPRAQGVISLSSGRPIAKKDMLFVLENALHANNLIMLRDATGYRIEPANTGAVGATDRADGANGAQPGYGVTVIPLDYVSAATLSRLMEGFATRPGAVRADASGRLLVVVGTGAERQSAIETARSFDVDWMRGQSVGLYPVQNSAPDPIVAELEKIMDTGESGLGHGLVKFQAVAQQNAILVVAAKPDLLRQAAQWISRLDSPATASASVKVYKVRYGDAGQIAQLLQQLFVAGGQSAAKTDSATNQLAPGANAATLTATERLTGGRPAGAATGAQPAGAGQGTAAITFGGIPVAALNAAMSQTLGGSGVGPMADVRITADTVNNSLLIYANAENYRIIERTLNQLDRPKLQVAIDVTIAEVDLNDQLAYGVQFFLNNGLTNTATGQLPALSSVDPTTGVASSSAPAFTGGFNFLVGNALAPAVVINALHGLTDVKILSNPSLVVVDNGEATLQVGDQVPVSTGSATVLSANNAVVNTVDYQNTGIILHVKPRVNSNGYVLLDVDQEISSVPSDNTSLTPTISDRKVKSSINVASGQTVLLAGLVSENRTSSRVGIPILDQTPWIGGLFSTTNKSKQRTELIMFIRPQIIRDGADAAEVAEEMRAKMRGGKIEALSLPDALNVGVRSSQ